MNQTTSSNQNLTIAVVGSGISGITAAFLLNKQYDVTLFEKNNYVGGHTRTVVIEDGPDKGTPVDTGFIVLNERTYPNFIRFLSLLGVEKEARVHVEEGIAGIKRMPDHVIIRLTSGEERIFSKVVIAAHADEALSLLDDPTEEEQRLLSPWTYSKNTTVLHTDASFMPPEKRAWASWNYVREKRDDDSSPITVTYHMNRLQRISSRDDYFVTLNPNQTIPSRHQIREITYTHPVYTFDSTATHAELDTLNGQHNTYFCGAYFGYGFHEDGVKSGIRVAEKFGISL